MISNRILRIFLLISALASPFIGAMEQKESAISAMQHTMAQRSPEERAQAKTWLWANTMNEAEQEGQQQSLLPRHLPPEIYFRILVESQTPSLWQLRTLIGKFVYDIIENPEKVPTDIGLLERATDTMQREQLAQLKPFNQHIILRELHWRVKGDRARLVYDGFRKLKAALEHILEKKYSSLQLPILSEEEREYFKYFVDQHKHEVLTVFGQSQDAFGQLVADYISDNIQNPDSINEYVNIKKIKFKKFYEDPSDVIQHFATAIQYLKKVAETEYEDDDSQKELALSGLEKLKNNILAELSETEAQAIPIKVELLTDEEIEVLKTLFNKNKYWVEVILGN